MRCKDARSLISLLYDGRLEEARRRKIESHIEGCGECCAEAELLEEFSVSLESLDPVEPREGGWERLATRIEGTRPARRSLIPVYGLAFLVLATAAALLLLHGRTGREVAPKQAQIVHKGPLPRTPERSPAPETQSAGQSSEPGKLPRMRPLVRKHHHSKPHIRHNVSPQPEEPPTPPVEQQSEGQYVAEAEPAPSDEISSQADGLVARGLSVLVEASATQESNERGDNL